MDSGHYLRNFAIESELGQGSFSTVYLGRELVQVYDVKCAVHVNIYRNPVQKWLSRQ